MARSKGSGGKKSSGSSKGKYRSAITGRYVTSQTASRHPKTTMTENPGARARSIKGRLRAQGRHFDDSTEIVRRGRGSE